MDESIPSNNFNTKMERNWTEKPSLQIVAIIFSDG